MTCPSTGRHHTLTAYWRDGCRCPDASRLASRRQKEYRTGIRLLTDGIGTSRRLKALGVLGYRQNDLAAMLGVTQREVSQLVVGRSKVLKSKAATIDALYQRLRHTPGPSPRCALYAVGRGWLGPDAYIGDEIDDPAFDPAPKPLRSHDDIDPVAVERACAGEKVPLTIGERRAAVRRLHAQGLSDRQMSKRLHLAPRTVLRIRQELGLAAVEAAA